MKYGNMKILYLKIDNKKELKTLWQKKKLFMMSNYSFGHNVFRLLQGSQKVSVHGEGLIQLEGSLIKVLMALWWRVSRKYSGVKKVGKIKPSPSYRRFLMTLEIKMTQEEIVLFLLLPQCFQLSN